MNKNRETPNFPRKYIYFEKQSNDRLCGVHCLNSLLQAPYFDPIMLSEIGLRLDQMENQLLGNKSVYNVNSTNVDDDGNYNVQVLSEALKLYGTELIPLKNKEAVKRLQNQDIEAFIFNSSTHWFAIRRIDGIWFNLNSTNSIPGPEIISDFYLSAFIQGTEDIGYTNFMVQKLPILPDLKSILYQNLQQYQKLVEINDIIKVRDSKKEKKEENKDSDPKFKAFTGKGVQINEIKVVNNTFDGDDEMKQAYELSLIEYLKDLENIIPKEPEDDTDSYYIILKYNDNTFDRRFKSDNTIYDIMNYCKLKLKTFSEIELFETFPRKVYNQELISLKDAGLSKKQILMIKLL